MDAVLLGWSATFPTRRDPPVHRRTAVSLYTVICLVVASVAGAFAFAQATTTPMIEKMCGDLPTTPNAYACLAQKRNHLARKQVSPQVAPNGLAPADLQSAYALPSGTAGTGQTVAIVDAMDDPNAEADLAVYR